MASLSKGILKSSGFIDINPRLAAVAIYLFNDISMIFFFYQTSKEGGDSLVGFSISTFYINMIKEGKDKLL